MTAALAVAQFAPTSDRAANLATIREQATVARQRGATLVVFPEYSSWFGGPPGPELLSAGEDLDGEFVTALGAIARDLGIHVVAGMVETVGERVANTIVAVDPAGEIVSTYRKTHLYDAFGQLESEWIAPGDTGAPITFPWAGFTVGLQTCYDIRFPESSRWLVDAGADLLLVPAEWVRGPLKEHHWRTLLTARAIENTVFLAAADHIPPVGVGSSMILDPMGIELATIGEQAGVVVAHLDSDRLDEVRAVNPALALRRFGVAPKPGF